MKMHELLDVLRCRSRERGALGGTLTESAAFFRLVLFGGDLDFDHQCLHNEKHGQFAFEIPDSPCRFEPPE